MKPILFTIGPFHVFAFGFFLCLSFILSSFIVWKFGKEELVEEELTDAYVYTSLASLIFARFFYILFNFGEFGSNILKYIVVREIPGLSLSGGLLGGSLFLLYYAKRKKLNFFKVADIFAITGTFALSLVSVGELLGGASFGKVTNLPWGINVVGLVGRRHPVEIYSFILYIVFFVLLVYLYRHNIIRKSYGLVSYIFLFFIALIIFLLEFLKERPIYLYSLGLNQIIALVVMVVVSIPLVNKIKLIYKSSKKLQNHR